jgi:hypothetical protein
LYINFFQEISAIGLKENGNLNEYLNFYPKWAEFLIKGNYFKWKSIFCVKGKLNETNNRQRSITMHFFISE